MPTSLEIYARQSLFIVREGNLTKRVNLPSHWQVCHADGPTQLLNLVQEGHASAQRTLLIVSDDDFSSSVQCLKEKTNSDTLRKLGALVIAKDPEAFLRYRQDMPEFLDVVLEKEFRRAPSFYVQKSLRQLIWTEERGNRRASQKTLQKLNEIFIALSAEREPEKLLVTILVKAIDLASAEGGLLYMIQERDGELYFRQKIAIEISHETVVQHAQIKVQENSICGYVAMTGKILNIADISSLRPMSLPQFNRVTDCYIPDRTKSVLTVPLKNNRNDIIAVLQLVNKIAVLTGRSINDENIGPFEAEEESLIASFGTQAAICLENVDLYDDIQRLFDGFVKASITAIESRDPSTGGHSERVAKMTVALARATSECAVGIYRSVRFKEEEIRELQYAALLHDFGKIGVREEVLVKAKKLHPWQLDGIRERMMVCKAAAKIAYLERRLKHMQSDPGFERDYMDKVDEIEGYWGIIMALNEPSVVKGENLVALEKIRNEQLLLPDGTHISPLSDDEYNALSITQGSLTESERLEVESHVRHSYQFLKMIPWTRDFKHLTEIAYAHHEKLDGSGYPRGLMSHEIPLQSKIMTIADIYDALTAADRWYKEAVPCERALDILSQEVAQGKLDPVLFELFVEKKIYEITHPKLQVVA